MSKRGNGVALIAVALMAAGCGSGGEAPEEPRAVAVAAASDTSALFADIARSRKQHGFTTIFEPRSLAESLPNQRFVFDDTGEPVAPGGKPWTFSEAVVLGEVVKVALVPLVPQVEEEDLDAEHASAERDLAVPRWSHAVVTVAVERFAGDAGIEPGDEVDFRYPVAAAADPEAVAGALGALGRALVIVDTDENGDFYAVLRGALIAEVDDAGQVAFSGLRGAEREFVGDADRAAEIFELAASRPRSPLRI